MDNFPGQPRHDQEWGPAPALAGLTLLLMLGALAWRLLDHDPENRLVATVLVVVLALTTLALVRIRVRLRADRDGIAVTGPLRTRRIPWSRIRSISAPQRGRFGRPAAVLELEVRPDDGTTAFGGPVAAGGAATGAGPAATGGEAVAAGDEPDDELLTFGRFDLGADPAQVCRQLLRHRRP